MAKYRLKNGVREIKVIGDPRRVSGGYVVTVCWATDDTSQRLGDGTIHPAHRAGWAWEEPTLNILSTEGALSLLDRGL